MKKNIFFLAVLFLSGALVILSISTRNNEKLGDKGVSIDLKEGEKLYGWNKEKDNGVFEEISLSGSDIQHDFYYHRFSPIDGVYYRSDNKNPMEIEVKDTKKILTFGTGVFICDFENTLADYEIHISGAVIQPLERGVFLIDTTRSEPVIFSFNSFLQIGLIEKGKETSSANLTLFPSLLFRYNQNNTINLRNADILRISLINSLYYLDLKNQWDMTSIFRWENTKDSYFLKSVTKHITGRIESFKTLYKEILWADSEKLTKNILLNPDNILFVNDAKKEVFLRNLLIKEILELLQENPTKKPDDTTLREILTQMKEKSPHLYEMGLSTIRRYYYVMSFSRFTHDDKAYFITNTDSPYLAKIEGILWYLKERRNDSYRHLSDIFSLHYFSSLTLDNLNMFVNELLANIIDNKVLSGEEFLSFTFFVTEYLSGGPFPPSKETLQIISLLSSLTDDYYNTLTNDSRRSVLLSTIFYNYNKIFSKLNRVFTEKFFNETPKGIIFKEEYLSGNIPTFGQDFRDSFKTLTETLANNIERKRKKFYTLTPLLKQNSNMSDNYTLLDETLKNTNKLRDIFLDYPEYLKAMELNDKSRQARGILITKTQEMNRESLEAYLSTFNNMDTTSLQIFNNFKRDGFYDLQVRIGENTFSFKLWPQDHTISDISFLDISSKKHIFPNSIVPLDQKEKQFKELLIWAGEPELRYRYDFKNFFETTFLQNNSDSSVSISPSLAPVNEVSSARAPMTPEMQIFVQKELVEKDFKNIATFLPIGFNNIYATIQNGNYAIELSSLKRIFIGKTNSYSVEFSGKYVLERHTFYRLTFQVPMPDGQGGYEFDGKNIEILPTRILLTSLEDTTKDLGRYIDVIKKEYQGQQSIVIDFSKQKVLLDSKEYTPDFSITQ